MGGRRRHRHARHPGGRGRREDVRGLDRPRRVPARIRERLPDDDAERRRRRPGLHARASRGALRHPAVPDPRLHRPEGRLERQHPRNPRDRRQDRRAARRAVRVTRGGRGARRRAVARPLEVDLGECRAGGLLEDPRDDATRPRPRRRFRDTRPRPAGPLGAQGDLPPLRVPRPPESRRHARRAAAGRGASCGRDRDCRVARGRPEGRRRPRGRGSGYRPRRRRDRGGRGDRRVDVR